MNDTAPGELPGLHAVPLYGDGGLSWRRVSGRLVTARMVVLGATLLPVLVLAVGLALAVWSALWVLVAAVVLVLAAGAWVIVRQVPAISWAEAPEELVVRRGRMFRTLVSVPYGRLQFVDVESGPVQRRFGLATVELHTASPDSGAHIPGLPTREAEELRTRLAARGESQRAGL